MRNDTVVFILILMAFFAGTIYGFICSALLVRRNNRRILKALQRQDARQRYLSSLRSISLIDLDRD